MTTKAILRIVAMCLSGASVILIIVAVIFAIQSKILWKEYAKYMERLEQIRNDNKKEKYLTYGDNGYDESPKRNQSDYDRYND